MRREGQVEVVRVRASDLLKTSQVIVDNPRTEIVLIARNGKFRIQARIGKITWSSEWRPTLNEAPDCSYVFTIKDFLEIQKLALFENPNNDFISFTFKDGKLVRVATSEESLWFKYSNKI